MKTRRLEKHDGRGGILIDAWDDHKVMECFDDVRTLFELPEGDERRLTLEAINSGYSVDMQRVLDTRTKSVLPRSEQRAIMEYAKESGKTVTQVMKEFDEWRNAHKA